MVVGDQKPYLNCLISLMEDPPRSGKISKSAVSFLAADALSTMNQREMQTL